MEKRTSVKTEKNEPLIKFWLFIGLPGITLYFNSRIEDPFNTSKFILLINLSAFIFASCLVYITNKNNVQSLKVYKIPTILVTLFSFGLLLSTLNSDSLFTSLFGDYQRKNGLISYLCLAILFLYGVIFAKQALVKSFYKIVLFTGAIFSFYGILQNQGRDFVTWNNPYNSIITTLGNPNFSSAVAAIISMLVLVLTFSDQFNLAFRLAGFVVFTMNLYIIIESQSRQGLVSLGAGLIVFITLKLWFKSKKIGIISATIGFVIGVVSVLGMLQVGPLEKLLYKDSVSVRGYYWRAGIEMFRDNILFGVGLDRYGSFFKEYREPSYVLKYGYDITSSNAHNVYIQLFSTGGLILGLSYIALMVFILKRGLYLISSKESYRLLNIGLLSGWIVFQSQSVISIDNIGISVWGWILAGLIVGISYEEKIKEVSLKPVSPKNSISLKQPAITALILIPTLILSTYLFRSENNAWLARSYYNPNQPAMNEFLSKYSNLVINNPVSDPELKFKVAGYLIVSGDSDNSIEVLEELISEDPRNQEAIRVMAVVNSNLGFIDKSISNRRAISELDPWNANNLLELGKLYLASNNFIELNKVKDAIIKMAPNSMEAQAIKEITDSIK